MTYETLKYTVVSWFNRFTTGGIPADAKGAELWLTESAEDILDTLT